MLKSLSLVSILIFTSISAMAQTPYENALKQAQTEDQWNQFVENKVDQRKLNEPIRALQDVKFDFENLRSEIRILVFPKSNTITERNAEHVFVPELLTFRKPQTFRITERYLSNCHKLVNFNGNVWTQLGENDNQKELRPREFFSDPSKVDGNGKDQTFAEYKDEGQNNFKCAVLKIEQFPPLDKSQVKKDDFLRGWIFIDENLRPYGKAIEIAEEKRAKTTRIIKIRHNSSRDSLASGLSYFPIDIPNFLAVKPVTTWKKAQNKNLLFPSDVYVTQKTKKYSKLNSPTTCRSDRYLMSYADAFENPIRLQWCQGHPWPSVVENNRFFAILIRVANQ